MRENGSAKQPPPAIAAGRKQSQAARESALSRFTEVLLHLPQYSRLAWGLLRDNRLDRGQKALLLAGVGYLALPLDLVPGIIPVAGQLDDLTAIVLALRTVVRSLPDEVAAQHLRDAGLGAADLDRDLESLGITALWLVRKGGGLALRALGAVARTVFRGVGASLGFLFFRRPSGGRKSASAAPTKKLTELKPGGDEHGRRHHK